MEHREIFEYLGHTFTLEARPTDDGTRWEGFFFTVIPSESEEVEHRKKIRGTTPTPEDALKLAKIGAQYFLETLETIE